MHTLCMKESDESPLNINKIDMSTEQCVSGNENSNKQKYKFNIIKTRK